MTLVPSSDGKPGRLVREWDEEKLFYVERYMDIFATAMKGKWRLVYIDLFAGPGRNVTPENTESDGSPLRALRFPFDAFFFNDLDAETAQALEERVRERSDGRHVEITQMDGNEAAVAAGRLVDGRTLALGFIDPFAYEIQFEAIRRMTAGRRIDLIVTFMTNFARRFSGVRGFDEGSDFDLFMGTRAWLPLRGRSPGVAFTRKLLDIYEEQLRSIGYANVDDDARILNSKQSTLYHLVFGSKDPLGKDFFDKISQRDYRGQRRML